jgi:GH15 family glucan-1,4-alpha-glucosidase
VRIGNDAFNQAQFDILGAIVDCVYQHTRTRDSLSERAWKIVLQLVEKALKSCTEPDQSIWENRGEPRHYNFTKLMCWVAADRGARLAALRGERTLSERWWQAALKIHADICEHGVDEHGRFTQCYGSNRLDGSLLLLPLVRFLPPDDERIRTTVFGIASDLSVDGLMRRYRTADTDDGLGEPESTFTVCSFWLVSAFIEIGELEEGRKLCERLLGSASGLGLYGEELDPSTGRHRQFPSGIDPSFVDQCCVARD